VLIKLKTVTVARELFLDRGSRPSAPKSGTRNTVKVFAGIGAFFVPETRVLQKKKKKVFAGFGALKKKGLCRICPKNGSGYRSQGGKSRPGEAKIIPGGQLPPTSRAYEQ